MPEGDVDTLHTSQVTASVEPVLEKNVQNHTGSLLRLLLAAFALTSAATTALAAIPAHPSAQEPSAIYRQVQRRLAQGWNTWDVNSVTTQVLLPEGLSIQVGLKHNATEHGDLFLAGAIIGRLEPNAEHVTPGSHAWDGSYTDASVSWQGHTWRIQTAHAEKDLVLLATPLTADAPHGIPPTIVFTVNFLWNRPGTVQREANFVQTRGSTGSVPVFCTCPQPAQRSVAISPSLPVTGPYFAAEFNTAVGISTGKARTIEEIKVAVEGAREAYEAKLAKTGEDAPIVDAIETTLGWDTIYEPEGNRVVSPVSRAWCLRWGGYVLFEWDTFFAATLASIGDRDLAYANAIEMLHEETPEGFVPNYARTGGWKSFDRSEPPVGAITVLGLYQKFHDRWFLQETFAPLMRWNRWWATHRDMQGYLVWGSNGDTHPTNPEDRSRGTLKGAIFESGLDNSPMYDGAVYNSQTQLLEFADVGLMGLYIADCKALAQIADLLEKPAEAKELRERAARYGAKLQTMWSAADGIFLNKDLHTGQFDTRLSPTNFYPLLAGVATPAQAQEMLTKHLLNPKEFWGQWVIPSIARNDPAFADQNYWRGRIWGPMNYLVYLGLEKYADSSTRQAFAQKSYELFLGEWKENGHVHENYNAILGTGDDVTKSDRFYHWGALLGYVKYLEDTASHETFLPH